MRDAKRRGRWRRGGRCWPSCQFQAWGGPRERGPMMGVWRRWSGCWWWLRWRWCWCRVWWAERLRVWLPAGRRAGDLTYYAKHYTFNLQMDAEVTIDLTSGTDTYLLLLRGHGPEGTEIDHDDNGGVGHNSRLSYRPRLEAGDYTVAASTSSAETTGSFNLAVRAVAHATTTLGSTLDATVGHTQLEEFAFSPAGIAVPTIAPASTPGLDVSVNAANYVELDGKPSLRFTARRADTWALRLVLTQPGRTDTHRFTITAVCPRGDTTAPDGTASPPAPGPPSPLVASRRIGRAGAGSCTVEGGPQAAPQPRCPHPRPGTTVWT